MTKLVILITAILLLTITAFQCREEKDCCLPPLCSEKPTLTGIWRLESYENQTTGVTEKDPDPDGKGVVYTFTDNEKEGSIEGHTVMNTVSGGYSLDNTCNFKVLSFGGSKVGEPAWSNKAWLPSDKPGYYQRHDNKLVIYFNGSEERLVFKKI